MYEQHKQKNPIQNKNLYTHTHIMTYTLKQKTTPF